MILIKILFAVLIIVCAVFYVLYIWDFSLVLLIVIASLPVLMFLMLFITKKLISVELAVKSHSAAKNEPFDVQLCVENRSIFPVGKAEAVIEYYNIFNNQINSMELHFPIQSRNTQRLTFQLSSKFCGVIKIRSACITIYDPLRIFKFRIGRNICKDIAVLPEGQDIGGTVDSSDRLCDESSVFSEYRPGDDPSEVFDLREYAQGDKLNRIHWKLSSKKDEFIVKEYSMPVDSPAAVFLDLHCTENSEYTLPIYDTLLETLVSVSQLMLENERVHTIIYYDAAQQGFAELTIDSTDALASAVSRIILSLRDDLFAESPELYFSEPRTEGWVSFTLITAQQEDSVFACAEEDADAYIKNIIAVVKNSSSAETLDKQYSSVCVTPVVIGRISSSIRDIEL